MIRMPLSLDPDEKRWLDRYARAQGKSAAGVIREALGVYRAAAATQDLSFRRLLDESQGTWKRRETPLAYQRRMRKEWDRRG